MIDKICIICCKKYKTKPCRIERSKCCSKKCQLEYLKIRGKEYNNKLDVKQQKSKSMEGNAFSLGKKHKKERSLEYRKMVSKRFSGANHRNWRGGKYIDGKGYIRILAKQHPHCDRDGYVMEHRLVMENYLGRYLKLNEVIHHIDENKQNNNINNLMIFSDTAEHTKYHKNVLSTLKV